MEDFELFKLFSDTYRTQAEDLNKRKGHNSSSLVWQHFKMLVWFCENKKAIFESAKENNRMDEYYAFLEEFPELKDYAYSGNDKERRDSEERENSNPDEMQEIY